MLEYGNYVVKAIFFDFYDIYVPEKFFLAENNLHEHTVA